MASINPSLGANQCMAPMPIPRLRPDRLRVRNTKGQYVAILPEELNKLRTPSDMVSIDMWAH
jgi:hypothetical protein